MPVSCIHKLLDSFFRPVTIYCGYGDGGTKWLSRAISVRKRFVKPFKKLILINSQDSEPPLSGLQGGRMVIGKRGSMIATLLFLVFSLVPTLWQDKDFSFAKENPLLHETVLAEERTSSTKNSQNLPVLRVSQSSRLSSDEDATGGGYVRVVGKSALVAETGLFGTESDIVELERKRSTDQISIYIVKEGDSLSEIADMFEVSANTIVWANDLSSKTVTPGQELLILPVSGVRHEVKKGDTLASIAKKYKGDETEIAKFNGLKEGASLSLGDTVTVPNGEINTPAPKRSSNTQVSSGSSASSAPAVAAGGGYFIRPASGVRTQGIHGYNGIDIGAPVGAPVYAAASGKVLVSKSGSWNGGYGNYIVIKHDNGTQTLYAHNSQNVVGQGQWVEQGQVIGHVGSTGRSTGPHLHFEVRGARNPF